MDIRDGFIGAIGNTPLIKLQKASEVTGCTILGKAEFLNPGGSVKDRAALFIIEDAEQKGQLRKGGLIVEGTAGNTGIGLALVGNARGYKTLIVIPDTQSQEKKDMLRLAGAELKEVPAVPYRDPNNYVKVSGRLAEELKPSNPNGVIWANQFDNVANRQSHYESTGPEIWEQTAGRVDAFTCAVGTGGTLAGVSRFLKERNPAVKIVLADPPGSALHSYVKTGEAVMSAGPSITEGIGNSRVTDNLLGTQIDDSIQISDQQTVSMVYRMLREEGWFFGSSTGLNLVAAVRVAADLGPGHTIVTVLCDGGGKYQSRLFNLDWLRERGLHPDR
jgi:cysteine synthase